MKVMFRGQSSKSGIQNISIVTHDVHVVFYFHTGESHFEEGWGLSCTKYFCIYFKNSLHTHYQSCIYLSFNKGLPF